ncbi:O-antigen ligase family protein [Chitinibacter sp. S2-10]|uniref:O-antigen ligase family protein n=1 Tax=Chitinibacter sp. S2-10 TaxID=3373597 RepID=UPI0039779EA0
MPANLPYVYLVEILPFFENARYLNSVQIVLLFFCWLLLVPGKASRSLLLFAIFASSLNLALIFLTGARSALLAILIGICLIALNKAYRRDVLSNASLVLAGGLLIYLSLWFCVDQYFDKVMSGDMLPRWLNAGQVTVASLTSGRYIVWGDAIRMMQAHPWLGSGGLHFASMNSIAAHPHNLFLMIGAEWGVPMLLLLVYRLGRFSLCVFKQRFASIEFGLLMAILVESLFSGNLVYPMSQSVILAALILMRPLELSRPMEIFHLGKAYYLGMLGGLLLLGGLTFMITHDYPSLYGVPKPNFWFRGTF